MRIGNVWLEYNAREFYENLSYEDKHQLDLFCVESFSKIEDTKSLIDSNLDMFKKDNAVENVYFKQDLYTVKVPNTLLMVEFFFARNNPNKPNIKSIKYVF